MTNELPRAYLRLDPNLDVIHPDVDGFVRLLCMAHRQKDRGRFESRASLEGLLGKARTGRFYTRHDVADLPDGRVYVVGWDEWQEGDLTVAERMRRMRGRRRDDRHRVTLPPSPGRSGVTTDASTKNTSLVVGDSVRVDLPPPPAERGRRANGTDPRSLGVAPRQTGTAPRDLGTSPRQERELERRGPTSLGEIMRRAAVGSSSGPLALAGSDE